MNPLDVLLGIGVLAVVFILGIGHGRMVERSNYFAHLKKHIHALDYGADCNFCAIEKHFDECPHCQPSHFKMGARRAN